ncbi:ABC transporter substrate-binding protein [Chloroflexota bacterium]
MKKGGTIYDAELVILNETMGTESALPDRGSAIDYAMWNSVNERLAEADPATGDRTVPQLAESWETNEDCTKWTFHLRKGIPWQDGWGEFTAEDVKYSIKLGGSEWSVNSDQAYLAATDVVIEDHYTVVVNFAAPDWAGQVLLCAHMPIVCKKYCETVGLEEANLKPIGTGPYKLHSRRAGEFIKFEAVPDHWRKTAEFKHFTVRCVPEVSTRMAMLKTGEADFAPFPADKVPELRELGIRTIVSPVGHCYWVVFPGPPMMPTHTEYKPKPWWDDPAKPEAWEKALKVRKAMSLAIDREQINKSLLSGMGTLAVAPYIHSQQITVGADPSWKPDPYAPDEARGLLAEAGYPDGFDITVVILTHSGRPGLPQLSEMVATYWEQIGLNVTRVPMDFATLRPLMVARKLEDIAWVFGNPFHSVPSYLISKQAINAGPHIFTCNDAWMEEWAPRTHSELDAEKRVELTRQVVQHMRDNQYTIPLVESPYIFGVSERVGERSMILSNRFPTQPQEYITLSDSAKAKLK